MDLETIEKINKLNQRFYKLTADPFSKTRQDSWPGWFELAKRISFFEIRKHLKILDLGCGNGRFAHFLYNQGIDFEYIGIDSSPELLEKARKGFQDKSVKAAFYEFDLIRDDWAFDLESGYDLILLFGVMHHLPGETSRKKILTVCNKLLSNQGFLVFTTWQFLKSSHLQKRIVFSPDFDSKNSNFRRLSLDLDFDLNKLGEGDYILDWQKEVIAYRYCHNYSEQEVLSLCQESGLQIYNSFEADGKEGDINRYYICKKQV